MIKVINVTKNYKISRKKSCLALNNVSFMLPDKGLIFIVGKSGSGKSTLLNIIGGLDSCTSGTIIADGNDVTSLYGEQLTNYRSSYVGFIFQDYHVLENLTVLENVSLVHDLKKENDKNKIEDILEKLELLELKNRYPKELSGGQKQRVAIARAVSKDVNVLLCDEPSGNLDKKTTTQVLSILKEISKTKLVIVVSHSLIDAQSYADRIIELSDGQIIRDRSRTQNYNNNFRIEDGNIYLPHYHDLEEEDLILLNNTINENDNLKFIQINNRFYETKTIITEEEIEKEKEISKHRHFVLKQKKIEEKKLLKSRRSEFKKLDSLYKKIQNGKYVEKDNIKLQELIEEARVTKIIDRQKKEKTTTGYVNWDEIVVKKTNKTISEIYDEIWSVIVKNSISFQGKTYNESIAYAKAKTADDRAEFKREKLSKNSYFKLYKMLFSKKVSTLISVILAAMLLVCFAIFQSFLSFDGNKEISDSLSKYDIDIVPIHKGSESESYGLTLSTLNRVTSSDKQAFYDAGFKGNIYSKYSATLPINVSATTIGNEQALNVSSNLMTFYIRETFGVIVCDEQYLINHFGTDGKLNFLARAKEEKSYGIYIPDYIADSMIKIGNVYNGKSYEDIIGEYKSKAKYPYGYINGIFDTNYETKYKSIKEKFDYALENPNQQTNAYEELKSSKEFTNFITDAMNYLAFGYSLNQNFYNDIQTTEFKDWSTLNRFTVNKGEGEIKISGSYSFYDAKYIKSNSNLYSLRNLTGDQMIMSSYVYNAYFNTSYSGTASDNFKPHKVTFTFYENHGTDGEIVYQKEFEIVALGPKNSQANYINFSENLDLLGVDITEYGIILDTHEGIANMANVATEHDMLIWSTDATKLSTINRLLKVFGEFFLFIELFFLLIALIFLVYMGISSVKKAKYEIGVLKAIGVSSLEIMSLFMIHALIIALLISAVSNVGIYFGTMVANEVMVSALDIILDVKLLELKLISYIPSIVVQDLFNIIIISIVSFIIPQALLFRIKPIEIIRAKE